MQKKNRNSDNPSGIVLYAKRSGITSFSSLWSVKKALHTDKVGHTGTLDSFAEGLLVVLSGSLTHIVSHVSSFRKKYRAVICFGTQTDTLDPLGRITGEGRPLSEEEVTAACSQFTGVQLQVPPVFSAVHVDGQRASDLARKGGDVELASRQVFIYKNELVAYKPADENDGNSYALIEVECSKGTYIRALARDMAASFGSVAHLSALRRTQVGPFVLEDAACFSLLGDFTIESAIEKEKLMREAGLEQQKDGDDVFSDIRNHFLTFNPQLSFKCGLKAEKLTPEAERPYLNGRPLSAKFFEPFEMDEALKESFRICETPDERSVFYTDEQFAGVTHIGESRPEYSFVVPKKKRRLRVFSWADLQESGFPASWKEKGTALSVGSFDALHRGHMALVDAVLAQKRLVPGIVLFRRSFRGEDGIFLPSVMSLRQRLALLEERGVSFAIVLDFSPSLARTAGPDFLRTLAGSCGMRYLAEGKDFRCGWKGSFGKEEIADLSGAEGFSFDVISDVELAGARASSSRVRAAVQAADFALATELLGRNFSYDCSPLRFSRHPVQDSDGTVSLSARMDGSQVCPPDGEYGVEVSFVDGKLGSGSAELALSPWKGSCQIQDGSISFRLPRELSKAEPYSLLF